MDLGRSDIVRTHRASRRTKIVCTIGPASRPPGVLEQLIEAGMDVARLNCSHGTPEERAGTIRDIREIAGRLDRPVAVLQDLAGPKVRIGDLASGPVHLETDQELVLTNRDVAGDAREVSLSYAGLPGDVQAGDTLLLSDGSLELRVEDTTDRDIRCRVVVGGPLAARKGVNVPSRSLRIPFMTDRDRRDLAFGIEHAVDYIALSFVREADDVAAARAVIQEADCADPPPLIAKIEKHEALENIDEILHRADGIMVARGDLGVEIPIERVPRVQKELIDGANRAGKPVITATQMLKSMVDSPRPTRAEATDVANAIVDGTDAVMLSEESAQGRYPVEAVEMLGRLAGDAETAIAPRDGEVHGSRLNSEEAVAQAATRLAESIGASAILTCTQSGSTTRLVSRLRPHIPLIAATPEPRTYRKLALVWGAVPLLMRRADTAEEMEKEALRSAVAAGLIRGGETVVITAGLPLHVPGSTNTVKVSVVQ
jgi:pyruvate kinase